MKQEYQEIWDDAKMGIIWQCGSIGSEIKKVLIDVELTPLLRIIPEFGHLVSVLNCLPNGFPYGAETFNRRMLKLEEKGPSRICRRIKCRSIEPIEFLYLAQLLIESYDNLSELGGFITEFLTGQKKEQTLKNWGKIESAYTDTIYKVLSAVDDDLADIWKKDKFEVLGPLFNMIDGIS